MTPAFFSLLAIVFFVIGFAPYILDIHHRRVKPHIMSWVGWGFVTIIGAIAMYADGSSWIAGYIAFQGFICFAIAAYAVIRKVAVYSTGFYDYILFVLGIIGVILWQVSGVAEIALIFAIAADLFFGLPTIIKTWKEPTSETKFPWGMNVISDITALFAIQTFVFHEVAYPIYLLGYDLIVFILILGLIKRKPRQ